MNMICGLRNCFLLTKFQQLLRRWIRVISDVKESQQKEWMSDVTLALHLVRSPQIESYGRFPNNCTWVREGGCFNARYVYEMRDVELYTGDGTICVKGYLLAESIGNPINAAVRAIVWRLFHPILRIRTLEIAGDSSADDSYVFLPYVGYFHFVIESLSALLYVLRVKPDAVVLVDKEQYKGFAKGYIDLLCRRGIIRQLRLIMPNAIYKVPRLSFCAKETNSGMFCRQTVEILKEAMNAETGGVSARRKIFITRRGRRMFDNQRKLEEVAADLGYEVVDTEGWTIDDQMALFKSASTVVANHGAGLTNIIYLPRGSKVIELFSKKWLNDCYFRLSVICDLHYNCLIADRGCVWGSINVTEFKDLLRDET